ncbi:MAG TPA: cytochrome c biogenesis protein CcdA [Spirochaetia bacterium]|nr:cytochrome c biogenesis protein CcdA [Spirochaetia bacterium]
MTGIFASLSHMLQSSAGVALLGSFLWGLLSVLVSPCHLASIPLIVGFISDRRNTSKARAFQISSIFAAGILVTIAIIGIVTGLMGRLLGDIGGVGRFITAALLFLAGLYLLGIIPLSFVASALMKKVGNRGLWSALLLGLVFGFAVGPCSFAFLAPVIGLAFQAADTNVCQAVGLFLTYAIGHCLVIVMAGSFSELVRQFLNWDEKSKGTVIIKRVCGALLIAGGIYSLFS